MPTRTGLTTQSIKGCTIEKQQQQQQLSSHLHVGLQASQFWHCQHCLLCLLCVWVCLSVFSSLSAYLPYCPLCFLYMQSRLLWQAFHL